MYDVRVADRHNVWISYMYTWLPTLARSRFKPSALLLLLLLLLLLDVHDSLAQLLELCKDFAVCP